MSYTVIYDGNCNLCSTLVQQLEQIDQGQKFRYISMQEEARLVQWQVTPEDCEKGMIVIDDTHPGHRWQGSDAAEEIARILPAGSVLIAAYRAMPGLKWMGDRAYEQIRDNRYAWFGRRSGTYQTSYPACETCDPSGG